MMDILEYGKAQDRLNELFERLRTASAEERPGLRREIEEARKASRKELHDLDLLTQQIVLRRTEIRTGLLHHIAELEDLGERLPDDATAEIRRRCEKLRGLVQEWR